MVTKGDKQARTYLDEPLLVLGIHVTEREVLAGELATQALESARDDGLDLTTFRPTDGRRQAQALQTTPGTDTAGTHVLGIQVATSELQIHGPY